MRYLIGIDSNVEPEESYYSSYDGDDVQPSDRDVFLAIKRLLRTVPNDGRRQTLIDAISKKH